MTSATRSARASSHPAAAASSGSAASSPRRVRDSRRSTLIVGLAIGAPADRRRGRHHQPSSTRRVASGDRQPRRRRPADPAGPRRPGRSTSTRSAATSSTSTAASSRCVTGLWSILALSGDARRRDAAAAAWSSSLAEPISAAASRSEKLVGPRRDAGPGPRRCSGSRSAVAGNAFGPCPATRSRSVAAFALRRVARPAGPGRRLDRLRAGAVRRAWRGGRHRRRRDVRRVHPQRLPGRGPRARAASPILTWCGWTSDHIRARRPVRLGLPRPRRGRVSLLLLAIGIEAFARRDLG